MDKKIKKPPIFQKMISFIFNVSLFVVLFLVILSIYNNYEKDRMYIELRLTSVFLNSYELKMLNDMLISDISKIEIYNSTTYKNLQKKLLSIQKYFSIPVYWAYLIYPTQNLNEIDLIAKKNSYVWAQTRPSQIPNRKWTILSALPVEFDVYNPDKTLPGAVFDYTPYPEFHEIIDHKKEFAFSGLSWDYTYNIFTKTYIYQIFNDSLDPIVAIGVDLPSDYLILTHILIFILSIGIFIFIKKVLIF